MGKKRLEYLDAMRGLAILLVVAGHLMIRFGISGYENVLWTIIISVHLPVFFFISGYLGGKSLNLKSLGDKCAQLIFPGFLFFVLFSFSRGGNPMSFLKWGFQEYWFTFVLFEMFLIYFICDKVFRRYKYVLMVGLSLVGVAYLSIPSLRGGRIDTILCLENLAKYFQFFTLGMLCKEYSGKVLQWLQKDWVKGGLLMGYAASLWLCFNGNFEQQFSLAYKLNHDLALRYIGVFVIFSCFIHNAEFFQSANVLGKSLTFVGKRTLDIYLIHYFLLPAGVLLPECLKSNTMWYVQLLIFLFSSIAVIVGCLMISELIRMSPTLSSLLLGTRNRKNPSSK